MFLRRGIPLLAAAGLVAAMATSLAVGSASASPSSRATIAATRSGLVSMARSVGAAPARSTVSFDVALGYPDAAAAVAAANAVSNPANRSYGHFYSDRSWEQRFSPSVASIAKVTSWLRSEGLGVTKVMPDRLNILASGTAARVERAFAVKLGDYIVDGHVTRLASTDATVPHSLAGVVSGVGGLSQITDTPDLTTVSGRPAAPSSADPSKISPPAADRNSPVCSKYWGQKKDTKDPSYGDGYHTDLPYAICGYTPPQVQSAYGLRTDFAKGVTGKGVTVAIVDAYESASLLHDGQRYFDLNDAAHPLATSQFAALPPATPYDEEALCGASGWSPEQTLDVESVHTTAPGADILYAPGADCVTGLYTADETVIDNHLADIITNSWGDGIPDLLDASSEAVFDPVLEMAAGTGIGVQFSTGDSGDLFTSLGIDGPAYPSSSPFVTAVGGTSLAVSASGRKLFETGWSTSKSTLCTLAVVRTADKMRSCAKANLGRYIPKAPGKLDYGGGGGTSYAYLEPSYQMGIVPKKLADRNRHLLGAATRVVPDISMDADPSTGLLIGETQAFPDGDHYGEYTLGGTSVASPLFAGVMALTDQLAGHEFGNANFALYASYANGGSRLYDAVPQGKVAVDQTVLINMLNEKAGLRTSVRTLGYVGPETYCDGAGNCETRPVTLTTAPGYDSMTGLGSPAPGFVTALSKF